LSIDDRQLKTTDTFQSSINDNQSTFINLQSSGIWHQASGIFNHQLSIVNCQFSVGWDLPLEDPQRWIELIEYCCRMGREEYDAMSTRAYDYAQTIINDPAVLEANRRLFES
jgi:hypothetical protein